MFGISTTVGLGTIQINQGLPLSFILFSWFSGQYKFETWTWSTRAYISSFPDCQSPQQASWLSSGWSLALPPFLSYQVISDTSFPFLSLAKVSAMESEDCQRCVLEAVSSSCWSFSSSTTPSSCSTSTFRLVGATSKVFHFQWVPGRLPLTLDEIGLLFPFFIFAYPGQLTLNTLIDQIFITDVEYSCSPWASTFSTWSNLAFTLMPSNSLDQVLELLTVVGPSPGMVIVLI